MGVTCLLICVGRAKESWIEEGINTYATRLRGSVTLRSHWLANDQALIDFVAKEPASILLDEKGTEYSSVSFAQFLSGRLMHHGARVPFIIGGPDGLPDALRKSALPKMSLSKMTLPHQMARLVLSEQLYRAFSILQGSPYHRA